MEPGKELDALIAEKIFGEDQTPRDVDSGHTIPHFPKVFIPYIPRNYSTDIAAAWEVVNHMRNKHWRDVLTLFSPEQECATPWRAFFSKKFVEIDEDKFESGESAPHAICLAALKAVGINVY